MIQKWIQKLFKRNNNNIDSEKVKEAINEYREEGRKLMLQLGEKFGLDIENPEDYEHLIFIGNKEIPRRGELSKRWNYNFHGSECGFYNKKHQQQIEVVLSNPPKFGHIDSWFLLSYMRSTSKYKKEVMGVNWQRLEIEVEKLYSKGEVEKIMK